jgi:hypothetical protein
LIEMSKSSAGTRGKAECGGLPVGREKPFQIAAAIDRNGVFLIGAPGVIHLLSLLAGLPTRSTTKLGLTATSAAAYALAGFAIPALAEPITRGVYRRDPPPTDRK